MLKTLLIQHLLKHFNWGSTDTTFFQNEYCMSTCISVLTNTDTEYLHHYKLSCFEFLFYFPLLPELSQLLYFLSYIIGQTD